MINRIKLFLIFLAVPFTLFSANAMAYNPVGGACSGGGSSSPVCQQAQSQGNSDPIAGKGGIISIAATLIAVVAGVAAVIMIIMGGFGLISSGGNAEAAAKARQRIINASIGLALIALSWTIIEYVTDNLIK